MNKLRDDLRRFQTGELTLNEMVDAIIASLPNPTGPGVLSKKIAYGYNIAINEITMSLWETKIPWEV